MIFTKSLWEGICEILGSIKGCPFFSLSPPAPLQETASRCVRGNKKREAPWCMKNGKYPAGYLQRTWDVAVLLFAIPLWALRPGAWYNSGTQWVRVPSRPPAYGWPWDIKRGSKKTEKSTKKKQQGSAFVWKEEHRCRRAGNSAVPETGYNLHYLLAAGRGSFMVTSASFLISLTLGRSLPCREIAGSPRCFLLPT